MDNDMALLHEKIDHLTFQIDEQRERLAKLETSKNGNGYSLLHKKLDTLTEYVDDQRRRQDELDELKRDLLPIANHMMKLSIDELAEIGTEFKLEDLLFLVKRLLRDTHLLVNLLDRIEATVELAEETQVLGKQMFHQAVVTLDRLERDGYFTFARGGWQIMERIVTEFGEEDIQALGDNIIAILTTVRNLTQPEIMSLANKTLIAFQEEPITDDRISMWSLMRDLSDPQVRRGLSRLLNLVKVLADQPLPQKN